MPLEAVREALTNAIVHADYSQTGAPIRVAFFDDRIEIDSPGLLVAGMTIGDIRAGVSKLRNRVIGRVFKELDLIEQWGSGFQRMIAACREMGLPEPVLEEQAFHFRVTISLKRVAEHPKMDATEQKIIEFLREREVDGGASTQDLSRILGMTPRSIRTRIARLLNAGKIVAVGKSAYDPKKRYLLANGE